MVLSEKKMLIESRMNDLCHAFDIDFSLLKQSASDDDWYEECFLINKQLIMSAVYKHRMYRVDGYICDVKNKLYLVQKEKKLLSILFRLREHSSVRVESKFFHDANLLNFPEEYLDKEVLSGMKSLFYKEILEEVQDWEILKCLVLASFRNSISTCMYLMDIKTIVWTNATGYMAYMANKEQVDFVRTVCAAEKFRLL